MNVFILGAVGAVLEYLLGIQETTVYWKVSIVISRFPSPPSPTGLKLFLRLTCGRQEYLS